MIVYPFRKNVGEPKNSFVDRCGQYKPTKYNPDGCHLAWDRGCPRGTPIVAIVSGTIVRNAYDDYLGWYVVIRHGWLGDFYLAHFDNQSARKVGEKVYAGKTRVGTAGDSGNARGVHLHVTWYLKRQVGTKWGSVPFGNVYPWVLANWRRRFVR